MTFMSLHMCGFMSPLASIFLLPVYNLTCVCVGTHHSQHIYLMALPVPLCLSQRTQRKEEKTGFSLVMKETATWQCRRRTCRRTDGRWKDCFPARRRPVAHSCPAWMHQHKLRVRIKAVSLCWGAIVFLPGWNMPGQKSWQVCCLWSVELHFVCVTAKSWSHKCVCVGVKNKVFNSSQTSYVKAIRKMDKHLL